MPYPISEAISDSVENFCGYIDSRGNVVIQPSYLACSYFFEGKASVIDETKKAGFIDDKARLVIPHQFGGLGRFHSGRCSMGGGYLDHLGRWLIPPCS